MDVAIVTGASRGLGLALARALDGRGWRVVVDGRDGAALDAAMAGLREVVRVPGDVTDAHHRAELVAAAGGPIGLVVNNASELGPSPQPALLDTRSPSSDRSTRSTCSPRSGWSSSPLRRSPPTR